VTETECAGLIVERVDPEGNASTIFIWGQKYRVQPGSSRWRGQITGNRLYLPKGRGGIFDASFTLKTATHLDAVKRDGIWPGKLDKQQ